MTEIQVRILDLFRQLAPAEQRELMAKLDSLPSGYEGLTVGQLAALDEGIAQAESGDTLSAADVFARVAARFGFSSA